MPRPHAAAGLVPAIALALATAPVVHALPDHDAPQLQLRSNIVDGFNLPPNSSFNSGTVALNDLGTVGMRLIVVGGTGGLSGIWIGDGDGTGTAVYQAPSSDFLTGDVALDGQGNAYFELFDVFTLGILRHDRLGGTTETIIEPGGPFGFNQFSDPQPDADGRVGTRGGNFDGNRWIRWEDGVQTSLTAEGQDGVAFLFVPRTARDTGAVAGKVRTGGTGGNNPDRILRYAGPGDVTIMAEDDDANAGSPFSGFDNGIGISPNGTVAFIASLPGGGRGVYRSVDGVITEIATEDDPLVSDISFFAPAVNDAGDVAFRGADAKGLDAVFVGDGTDLVRLVGEHDTIDTDLGLGRIDQHDGSVTFGGGVAINAAGDVAFAATLTPADDDQVEWGTGVFVAKAVADAGPDLDGDGDVDFDDLLIVLAAWGTSDPAADLDGDGVVGFGDLLIVLGGWTG